MIDPNKTQIGVAPTLDPNRTVLGQVPTIEATVTIKPVQCPVCKTFNPAAVMFCVECGLIFDRALPADAFGAPAIQLPCLVDSSGREYPIRPGKQVVGRQGDLLLEDSRVSRRHAEITSENGAVSVCDLGSTNGVKVNGESLSENETRMLAPGDSISFGGVDMVFALPGEGAKTLMSIGGKTQGISAPPTARTAIAKLVGEFGTFDLEPGLSTIGRKDGNTIVIAEPYISGKHGEIEVTDSTIFFVDVGSSNGSFVNEAKLAPDQRTEIHEGDVIKLGNLEFRVERVTP